MDHPLERLFRPRSLAVIGASRNPNKWGSWALSHTVAQGFAGPIYGINPSASPDDAQPPSRLLPSLSDMEGPVDVVMIALPRDKVQAAIEDCAEQEVGFIVLPTTGFGEVDEEGRAAQQHLLSIARSAGIRILGPNCFGLQSATGHVNLTPWDVPTGPIGLASQSGNVAVALHEQARWISTGFSACVGIGNQMDLGFGEILDYFAHDSATAAVGLYIEGMDRTQLPHFTAGLDACREAGKLVAVIKAGRTDKSAAAAATHTGSLAADTRVWRSVLRDHGAVAVDSPEAMMDVLQCAVRMPTIGPRVVLMADGGGDTVLAADAAEEAGFSLAHLSADTCAALEPLIPPAAPRVDGRNPLTLDTPGGVEDDPMLLARVIEVVRQDPAVDAIVIGGVFGGYGYMREQENAAAEAIAALHADGPPIAVQSAYAWSNQEPVELLKRAQVPVFSSIDRLLAAMSVRCTQVESSPAFTSDPPPLGAEPVRLWDPTAAAQLLQSAGVTVPPHSIVGPDGDIASAIAQVGLPAVVKVADPDITHKSDVGGVRLDLRSTEEVEVAAKQLRASFPGSPIQVMPMAARGMEVLLGLHPDPLFGPVVALGRGGVWTEVEDDVVLLRAPFSSSDARQALQDLRCAPMLFGGRGQPPCDVDSLSDLASRLGDLGLSHPDVQIDLNPVVLYEQGYAVVDIRIMPVASVASVAP